MDPFKINTMHSFLCCNMSHLLTRLPLGLGEYLRTGFAFCTILWGAYPIKIMLLYFVFNSRVVHFYLYTLNLVNFTVTLLIKCEILVIQKRNEGVNEI